MQLQFVHADQKCCQTDEAISNLGPGVVEFQNGDACAVTYSAFGDPVGRGGGSSPRIQDLDSGNYEFQRPTFNDGIINFEVISGPSIINQVNAPECVNFQSFVHWISASCCLSSSANFVSSCMEETGSYQSMIYLNNARKADKNRFMVLTTASNCSIQPSGLSAAENLQKESVEAGLCWNAIVARICLSGRYQSRTRNTE